jgi:hypothetical protein
MTHRKPAPPAHTLTDTPRRRWPMALAGALSTLALVGAASAVTVAPLVAPSSIRTPIGHNLAWTSLRMSRAFWFTSLLLRGYEAQPYLTLADSR